MTLEAGLVGLPNAGKSTLFNALTAAHATAAPYPFTTVDPNVGVVQVPEPRLEQVSAFAGQQQRVAPTLEVVDIAGLVEGAHRGEGLGNRFLARIREVDVVVHVVRCFGEADVAHPTGRIDPVADLETVDAELYAKDLETVAARLERERPVASSGDRQAQENVALLESLHDALAEGRPGRNVAAETLDNQRRDLFLLTDRPALIVANVSESSLPGGGGETERLRGSLAAAVDPRPLVVVAAQIESELAELDASEAAEFRGELGLKVGALERVVRGAFDALDLIVFFTVDGPEARAWTVARDTPVAEAVSQIHTDFRERFVRAEVLGYPDLESHETLGAARQAGDLRTVGRDYLVQDGDLVHVII